MAALNSVTWNLGKELWPQNDIYEELLKESPFLGRLKKDTSFGEDVRHIAVGTGMPQGVGPDFSLAKGDKSPSLADVFAIRAKTYYALFSIQGRLMRQAKIDKAVIVKPYARESKNAILQWKRDISALLYGNGGGAVGRLTSTQVLTGNTLVLADTSKIRFFQRGMKVQFSSDDGTPAVLAGVKPGFLTITGIVKSGVNKGTLTFDQNLNVGVPTIAVSDFMFRHGVYANVINGLQAWLPRADPGQNDPVTGIAVPTTFLGVTRTADTEAYSGIRIDGRNAGGVTQAGILAASALVDSSASPDLWLVSTTEWNKIRQENSAPGQLVYTATPATGVGSYKPGMSYEAFMIKGPRGDIKVLADPDCPTGRSYMLMEETWTLASTGALVELIESPMMEEFADSWESRFVGDLELYCEAPGFNATIQHATGA